MFVMPSQDAFVDRRMILKKIMIGPDHVSCYRRKTISSWCVIKVDIKKAYDKINSGFRWN